MMLQYKEHLGPSKEISKPTLGKKNYTFLYNTFFFMFMFYVN